MRKPFENAGMLSPMPNQPIHGVLTPHVVPLDSRGEINEPELRRYVEWLIEKGVHGLYPNGSTGEFIRLTVEERRRIIAPVRPVRPEFVFMTGWDAVLVPMLLVGCQGGTHATSGVVPEATRAIHDLTQAGRIDEALALQHRLITLFD
jgi:dihydrodipicolinate synthase/N-acetylneuraminate lyase